uniref:C2H2-type domain-containing protein n=1 Tax=Megaselia scalaris TaxID=36166 RepID=T1GQR9_MEGSC
MQEEQPKQVVSPQPIPDNFREDYTLEQEDVTFAPPPRTMPPALHTEAKESNFAPEVLKKLGVINIEGFCTICFKEYCSAYFLRTHKFKRHGISVMNPEPESDKQPLNLMLPSADESESSDAKRIKLDDESEKRIKLDDESEKVEIREIKRERSEEKTTPEPTPEPAYSSELAGLNLQKLQSMIMQLNDLNGKRPIMCHLCGKEMKNQYMLHVHITTEHMGENHNNNNGMFSGLMKTPPPTSPSSSPTSGDFCKQCNKQFNNSSEFKQHVIEVHGLKIDSPIRNGFLTPDRPINSSNSGPSTPNNPAIRPPYTITPTSSYCEICNKELCNKYFMKTHMQRMHGIEIENGAQIGGVVHKLNTHGISDDGSPLPNPQRPTITEIPDDPQFTSSENFSEICLICSRRFRSFKWLREHMKTDHGLHGKELDQQVGSSKPPSPTTLRIPNGNNNPLNNLLPNILGKTPFPNLFLPQQPQQQQQQQQCKSDEAQQLTKDYQCSMCPFTTPYYYFLIIHERSHTIMNNMPTNSESFSQDQENNAVSSERFRSVSPQDKNIDGPAANMNQEQKTDVPEEKVEKPSSPKPSVAETVQEGEKELMQAFFLKENIEEQSDLTSQGNKNRFVPAVVYLPVRERLSSSITVTFTLTPTQPQD